MRRRSILVPTLAMVAFSLSAEETAPATAPAADTGGGRTGASEEAVVISATRLDDAPIRQPYAITRLNRDDLDEAQPRLGVDAINFTPGVFVQHTAGNQASPYLRGLTGEQSLVLLDGVRLNHAANRPGPNQYSSLVPGYSLGSIDVVLGSASTVLGSDGLTGAVDLRLAEAGRGENSVASPWVGTRLASAEGSVMTEAGIDGRLGDVLYSVEGGYGWFGDLTGGHRSGERIANGDFRANVVPGVAQGSDDTIPNSHFGTVSTASRIAYVGLDDQRFELSGGFTRHFNAPRPDGHYENAAMSSPLIAGGNGQPRRIDRFYDPQDFSYIHARHVARDVGAFERIQSTVYWHRNREDQFRDRYASAALTTTQREEWRDRIDTYGIDLQLTNRIAQAHELTWGATWYTDRTSNGYFSNNNGVITTPAGATTVPDGSSYDGLGIFAQDLWSINERWDLLLGLRWSRYAWDYRATDERAGYGFIDGDTAAVTTGLAQDFSDGTDAFTGDLRLGYHPIADTTIFAGVGQGFRAPNLTNLAGNDLRASSTVVTANPELKPEKSLTFEVGAKTASGRDGASIGLFYTIIDDLIQPVYSSPALATQGNAEQAVLAGGELAFDWGLPLGRWLPVGHRLALVNVINYVTAEADQLQLDGSTQEVNISRANRLFGQVGLRYDLGLSWWAMVRTRWSDRYDEVGTGDAGDTRHTTAPSSIGIPGAMPGYAVVDVVGGWRSANGKYHVEAGIENIANATYRDVGSGTDGAGINGVLSAGARF
jgi:outer membrane receptor protein involved in Fe transport